MNGIGLSNRDRHRLVEVVAYYFARLGGVANEISTLIFAGLPERLVLDLPLSGVPRHDAVTVVTRLERVGHLVDRPEYCALGVLVEYFMNEAVDIEGKIFLSNLLIHYTLISDSDYIDQLRHIYPIPEVPRRDAVFHLGWSEENTTFTLYSIDSYQQLERRWSQRADFLDVVYLAKGSLAAQAVCLIERSDGSPIGSGFLIGPKVVMTNHHVVDPNTNLETTRVRFDYRIDANGQLLPGHIYNIASLLATSSTTELDYTIIELEQSVANSQRVALKLSGQALYVDMSVTIIQHPLGQPQKVVLQDNWVTYVARDHRRVQYITNTERGSSGSPVFNQNWEVVALHHSGSPIPPLSESNLRANEGIPIKAILPEISGKYGIL